MRTWRTTGSSTLTKSRRSRMSTLRTSITTPKVWSRQTQRVHLLVLIKWSVWSLKRLN
ncbi:hypothetical protein ACJX0J_015920, partial [Zea mays]